MNNFYSPKGHSVNDMRDYIQSQPKLTPFRALGLTLRIWSDCEASWLWIFGFVKALWIITNYFQAFECQGSVKVLLVTSYHQAFEWSRIKERILRSRIKVLLVTKYHQAFECPRRGRLRLKDFSSRCDVGVEAGVFFRLRAITCLFRFLKHFCISEKSPVWLDLWKKYESIKFP